ncbi:MAG TPA: hypothetical protein VJZ71_11995 [Phycisphaerae bacterium]|nr:hypothetical protein [Phycisphaerae bacterium]
MDQTSCPACGMTKDTWPNDRGVTKNGKTYCCQGCADGTGCTCEEPAGKQSGERAGAAKKM